MQDAIFLIQFMCVCVSDVEKGRQQENSRRDDHKIMIDHHIESLR
jgi:hypothetical protein